MHHFLIKLLVFLTIFSIGVTSTYSQEETGSKYLSFNRFYDLRISFLGEYSKYDFSELGSYSSRIMLDYAGSFGKCGFQTNINRGLNFQLAPVSAFITIPADAQIVNKTSLLGEPEYYEEENPFMAYISFPMNDFEISISTGVLTHSENINDYNVRNITSNNYSIDFQRNETKKYKLLLSGSVSYTWNNMGFTLGLLNIPVLSIGDLKNLNYSIRPLIGINNSLFSGKSMLVTNTKELELSHTQPVKIDWLFDDKPVNINAFVKSNFGKYSYKSFGAMVEVPVSSNFLFSLGYKSVTDHKGSIKRSEFGDFKNSLGNIFISDLMDGLNHNMFRIGFSMLLGSSDGDLPVRLINANLIQKNIYTAKREMYSYNPIGTVDLHNFGQKSVRCLMSFELPDKLGGFRSESFNLEPDEIKSIPVYLFLSEEALKSATRNMLANIIVESGGRKRILTSIPVALFDKNSWDGNTWGLKYFITDNDPAVISNAKAKYIRSFINDSTSNEHLKRFNILKNYITELGLNMHYIQDPASTIYIDRVQYPVETMNEKTGDCDDMAVYLAAHLMAVGYHCVLVDIKPQFKDIGIPVAGSNSIGHVFLLVDSGIESEFAGEIGLKEFQFVSRKSGSGKITAWIPVETTLIAEGFENSFLSGVRQYYEQVIEKDGIRNGTVHVYDE